MANIVNPNLPADLPTDWTTSQYVSPNGSEVSLSQQHGYNYLMEQVNAAQTAVNTLAEQAQEAVSGLESGALTATATRSGTTVAITGPEDAVTVTFLAPADWAEGDSYTYNGAPITVTDLNGNPVTDGWKQGAVLTFQISGGVAYFVGGASGSFLPLSGGTMTGPAVGAPGGSTIPQFRNVYYGTEALTPGSSPLPEGTLYITPEMEYEGAGKRTCRFVVGTSTAGWTAADCDYLCDGTADDVEINAAIQALPSTGGEIVILDGTYKITSTIAMNKGNVTLAGNGAGTILLRMSNQSGSNGVVQVTAQNGGCTVKNIGIDKDQSLPANSSNGAIRIEGSSNNTVTGCFLNGMGAGVQLSRAENNTIIGNIINNFLQGIAIGGLLVDDGHNIVSLNNLFNNQTGIYVTTFSQNNIINSNCVESSSSNGIYIAGNQNVISGNYSHDSGANGINISAKANIISNNSVFCGNGEPSSYTESQNTIISNGIGSSNLIERNIILGKNYVDNGTNNTWANNKFE